MENFLKPFLEKGVVYSLGKQETNTNGIVESSVKSLQKVIFKHDVVFELKSVLNSVCFSQPFTIKNDIIKKLIKRLCVFLSSDEDVKNKTDVLCCVFKSFYASCKGDESIHVLQFFIVLSYILGMNSIPNVNKKSEDQGSIINEENFKDAFNVDVLVLGQDSYKIFKELLLCISKCSVRINSPEVLPYNQWLQQLLKNLAHSQPFQSDFLEIFLISSDLDLKFLEGNLDYIFSNVLAQRVPLDQSFCDSFGRFLEGALSICAKYQRSIKFITRFLTSIKTTPTELVKDIILPVNVTVEFSKTVIATPNQQSLSIFDVLVQNLDECVSAISQDNSEHKTLLFSVTSELLISFLKEVKLFAPSIASPTLQKLIVKINTFKETLQKFGDYVFASKSFVTKNKDMVETYLELVFYCGEIQTVVNCYKESVLQPSEMVDSTSDRDWQCCLDVEQWDKLVNLVLKSKLKNCGCVCLQLALQKLRVRKLQNDTSSSDKSTIKIIINQLTAEFSELNIFQKVTPEDFAILMDVLAIEYSKSLSKNVLRQIFENENQQETWNWLTDSSLQENPVFIISLFSEVLNETGRILRGVLSEKIQSKLNWVSEDYFDGIDSISREKLELLPEKINYLLSNIKKVGKSGKEKPGELMKVLQVFKSLPLPYMKEDFRKLGLCYAVGVGTFLTDDGDSVRLALESICSFLSFDVDASTCFDIGLCIKWLSERSYEKTTNELRVKVIETLVRNSPNMKFGLSQMGEMIESTESGKSGGTPIKMLETRVVLYNELGKCWQRAKKRKSDNDLIGSYRMKLAKMISDEAKEFEDEEITSENGKIRLKILAIELNKTLKGKEESQMKELMEGKFHAYFDFAVRNLKKEFDEPSAVFLTVVLQSMPQLRQFLPKDSLLKMWKALKAHEKVNWRLFCTHSTDEEFDEILEDLLKMSKKFLNSGSDKHSSNCFEIWMSFFEFGTEKKRNSCQVRLQEFHDYIHECYLLLRELGMKKKWFLVKFFSFCLTRNEVIVTSHVLDTIIHVILECLDESSPVEEFRELFTAEADVASAILLRQFACSKSKVHLNFVIFKRMLSALMAKCNPGTEVTKDDVVALSTCAFSLEKWSSLIVKREKDFARISAYFITALISSIASATALPAVKFHLINCINHFLSISDSHTVAYLMRILKPGYQQVFNTVYNQFKKYHKYSGKV